MGAFVPAGDVGAELGVEVVDGFEDSTADCLSFDQAEPDLDEVEPGGVGRCEVDLEPGVVGQPCLDLGVLVRRVAVHHTRCSSTGSPVAGSSSSRYARSI